MEKVMCFELGEKQYEIFGTPNGFDSEVSKVLADGKAVRDFGVSWAGSVWGPIDFFGKGLAAYINEEKTVCFKFVHPSFAKYKDEQQEFVDVKENLKIPRFCFSKLGDYAELQVVTKIFYRYYYTDDITFCVDP